MLGHDIALGLEAGVDVAKVMDLLQLEIEI
jgi:hypothetical protein